VELMGPSEVLVALLEFSPGDASSPLFAYRGLPTSLDPSTFSPASLQRALPDQAGLQAFLNQSGRAFCLYVVLGSWTARARLVPLAASFVARIQIGPTP
jgi:hypothetical protein